MISKTKFLAVFAMLILLAPTLASAISYDSWTRPRVSSDTGYGNTWMSKDGEYMVADKMEGPLHTNTFWLFKTNSRNPIWKYKGKSKNFDFAVSKNGEYIAASGSYIRLFRKSSNRQIWTYHLADTFGVFDTIAISDDGKYIVAGNRAGSVYLFEPTKKDPIRVWNVTKQAGYFVNDVAISSDGRYIAAGTDQNVAFMDRTKENIVWKYKPTAATTYGTQTDEVHGISMSNSGKYFVATTKADRLYLFDKNQRRPKWKYYNKDYQYPRALISQDGKYITFASKDKYLGFTRGSNDPKWEFGLDGQIADLSQSKNGKYIAIADSLNYVYLFDREYRASGSQRPFRIYSGNFPESPSLSDKGDKLAYIDEHLRYKEVAPGTLADLQDRTAIYVKGQDMNLRMFVTNPNQARRMNVQVRLSLPTIAWWENISDDVKNENDNLVAKLLGDLMEGYGGDTVYNQTFNFDAQSSRAIEETIEMPGLNEPDWYNSWFMSFLSGGSVIMSTLIDTLGGVLEDILPDVIANTITQGLHSYSQNGTVQFYPTVGLGKVIVSDPDTGEVIDKDTFTFMFIIS